MKRFIKNIIITSNEINRKVDPSTAKDEQSFRRKKNTKSVKKLLLITYQPKSI